MRGDAQDVHGPGPELQHEQDGHALPQHGIDGQEVTGHAAGRPGRPDLPPGRRRPPRRGPEPGGGQDRADRPLPRPVSPAGQLAPGCAASPSAGSAAPAAPPARAPGPEPAAVPASPGRSVSSRPGAGARPAEFPVSRSGAAARGPGSSLATAASTTRSAQSGFGRATCRRKDCNLMPGQQDLRVPERRHSAPGVPASRTPGS